MSGHSKWHSIKHKKAATDAKRNRLFTKIIRELIVAARMGGSDPDANPRLRTALLTARDANMPKDTVERNVKKGAGELGGQMYEDVTYEGYGPGGVAILVECSTDNRNRTAASIRHIFGKYNGNLGAAGCVSYMFKKKGVISLESDGVNEDAIMETALEAGAEDFQSEEGEITITTDMGLMLGVRETLEKKGYKVASSELQNIPGTVTAVEGREAESLMKLLNMLEDDDDVMNVSSNMEASDEVMEKFMA